MAQKRSGHKAYRNKVCGYCVYSCLIVSILSTCATTSNSNTQQDSNTDAIQAQHWPEGKYITAKEVYTKLMDGSSEMLPLNVVGEQFYYLVPIP